MEIVKRTDTAGFELLPKRWIIERTFAWISRNRRLARDFERYATTAHATCRKLLAMNPNFSDGLLYHLHNGLNRGIFEVSGGNCWLFLLPEV